MSIIKSLLFHQYNIKSHLFFCKKTVICKSEKYLALYENNGIIGINCEKHFKNCFLFGWIVRDEDFVNCYLTNAYLTMQKLFSCPMEDCKSSYARKDHLNRHLMSHQGKTFSCPVESCNSRFVIKANMNRHVKLFHECKSPDEEHGKKQKEFVCPEIGCGKTFKYASKLATHEKSHGTLLATCLFHPFLRAMLNCKEYTVKSLWVISNMSSKLILEVKDEHFALPVIINCN